MMRKLPRGPFLVVLHVLFFFYLFLFDDIKNQSPSFQHKAQVSALIESMHEPWDVAFTSNLSVWALPTHLFDDFDCAALGSNF